jgi:hypothetical protein
MIKALASRIVGFRFSPGVWTWWKARMMIVNWNIVTL